MPRSEPAIAEVIARYRPRAVDDAAACFAREVTAAAGPTSASRAKAFLFAASRARAFAQHRRLAAGLGSRRRRRRRTTLADMVGASSNAPP